MTTARRISSLLHSEWKRLRLQPRALRQASEWGVLPGPVSDLDQVLVAVGFESPPTASTETALRRLVELAGTDELAARVVIQRLLPGLLSVASRRRRQGPGAFDELLGAAWIAVRTYRATRHPACIAAALVADADYRAYRKQWRRKSHPEIAIDGVELGQVADHPQPCPEQELAWVLATALQRGVDRASVDLVRLLATSPTSVVAAELEISARTVRNRRDRATRRISAAVTAA